VAKHEMLHRRKNKMTQNPKGTNKALETQISLTEKKFESVIRPDEKDRLDFTGTLLESAAFVFQYP